MINYEDFIQKYFSTASESTLRDVNRFVKRMNDLIGDIDIRDALSDKQLLCDVFFFQADKTNISRSHYQKIKSYLIKLFDFAGIDPDIPTRDVVISSRPLNNGYFRSLNDILALIDNVGKRLIDNYNPTTDLLREKAICIFGWLGFTAEEIGKIKRSDLTEIDNIGYSITNKYGTFELFHEPFAVLYYLRSQDSYTSIPFNKTFYLKQDTEFLIKPLEYSKEEMLNQFQVVQCIGRINDCIPPDIKKTIIFRKLHANAIFLEIYNANPTAENLHQLILDITKCDRTTAYHYEEQYLNFANEMDNNLI